MKKYFTPVLSLTVFILAFFYLNKVVRAPQAESSSVVEEESIHDSHAGHSHGKPAQSKGLDSLKLKVQTKKEFQAEFKQKYQGDWTFAKDKNGAVFRILSEKSNDLYIKSDKDFKEFGKEMAQLLDLGEGVDLNIDAQAERKTNFSKTQVVNQEYKGIPVIDATLQVTMDESGNVLSIENETYPVEDDVILEAKYSVQQAQEFIFKNFKEGEVSKVKLLSEDLQISPYHKPQEVSYQFLVDIVGESSKDFDKHRVFVGASSGKVISYSTLDH